MNLRSWPDSNRHHSPWQGGIVNHSTTGPIVYQVGLGPTTPSLKGWSNSIIHHTKGNKRQSVCTCSTRWATGTSYINELAVTRGVDPQFLLMWQTSSSTGRLTPPNYLLGSGIPRPNLMVNSHLFCLWTTAQYSMNLLLERWDSNPQPVH